MKTITLGRGVIEAIAGHHDEALRLIEKKFRVRITARGNEVTVSDGEDGAEGNGRVGQVTELLRQIGELHEQGVLLDRSDYKSAVALMERDPRTRLSEHFVDTRIATATKAITPRSPNQRRYIEAIRESDLVLGIGPAGTGKTYLAVAMAVAFYQQKQVRRIVLARPAVEAGERLGFLPGDIAAKVDPYLRPLYDALYDLLEADRTDRLLEQGVIEVAPLAFMRGRTLNESFIILDEAQNATPEQMKMFLTRIGFGSKAVVTGDVTQIDLPAQKISGLVEARRIIGGIQGIRIIDFDDTDVVRHPLVQQIVLAYDRDQASRAQGGVPRHGADRPADTGRKDAP